MLEQAIQSYLSSRKVAVGETVVCGWLVFRVTGFGPPIKLESLDFMRMASFTTDLRRAEVIYREQQEMLRRHGRFGRGDWADPAACGHNQSLEP
jgi:hypothetical protein